MATIERWTAHGIPPGFVLAPIHRMDETTPLAIGILTRTGAPADEGPFVLLQELPGARVYLGAIADAEARIQEWVEIWIQTLQIPDLAFSGYQTELSNLFFDREWQAESELRKRNLPRAFIGVQMESNNAGPILIKQPRTSDPKGFAQIELTAWRVCTEDALLQSHGLEPYSSSPHRYLHQPEAKENKTFIATSADSPVNSHVQALDRLHSAKDVLAVFNPHAGFIRVSRHHPLNLDDYLQILEGRTWQWANSKLGTGFTNGLYAGLQDWSANPKGLPFLLHGDGFSSDRLNEIFYLKLAALLDAFKEVRTRVKAQQLPLLNLSPASFHVGLQETGDQFPTLWSARCHLTKPGQAYPLKIKSTEQKYFIRIGRVEPSPFLPEGMGAHSFGIGNIQIRNVTMETDGVVLEGTLVAEDYLGLDPHDLLWFKLPLADHRLDFYAHVYKAESAGPREARFRTVPVKLAETQVEALKRAAGTRFPKSPYEVWPLLSSPCDLYSLGVMAVRVLLANSQSNLPIILDDILSHARHVGDAAKGKDDYLAELKALVKKEEPLLNLVSPNNLTEGGQTPKQARTAISLDIWMETVSWLLRLFPDTGVHSFCKDFGDVSPLALETVFDQPMQQLETILLRLRSILAPSLAENEEISNVILKQLKNS